MGKDVETVVKLIAPIALNALATAAEALLAGGLAKLPTERRRELGKLSDDDLGQVIFNDTKTFIESKFAETYGYYYQGLQSKPAAGGLPVAASEDIIVYDTVDQGIHDIESYLQTVFQDSISVSDSINISTNLGQLFTDRFQEESLSWTPFNKRYNFPDGTIVDAYMVTSAAHDVDDHLAGVVTYCFVAYGKQ